MAEPNNALQSALAKVAERQGLFSLNLTTDANTLRATRKTREPICIPLIIDLQNPAKDSVVIFPSIESVLLSTTERNKYRSRYERTDLIMPDNRIVRSPDRDPEGWSAYFLGVDGALDIALVQGTPYWMERLKSGWYLNILSQNESSANGRYRWWFASREESEFYTQTAPQLDLQDKPSERAILQLKWAMDTIDPEWQRSPEAGFAALDYLFDYLLWGLGSPLVPELPKDVFGSEVFDRLYQSFDSTPLLLHPYPYFGQLLADIGNQTGDLRYEPPMEPRDAKELAAQMFPGRREDYRKELFIDPDIDTGLTLPLAASNYTCNIVLTTKDTDQRLLKAAHLTAFFYVPWIMFPADWVHDDHDYLMSDNQRARNVQRRYTMAFMEKGLPGDYLESASELSDWNRTQPVQVLVESATVTVGQVEPTPLIPGTTWSQERANSFNPGESAERKVLIPARQPGQENRFKLSGRSLTALDAATGSTAQQEPAALPEGTTQPLDTVIDVEAKIPDPIPVDTVDTFFGAPPPPPLLETRKVEFNQGRLKIAGVEPGQKGVRINREADRVTPIQLPQGRAKTTGRKRGTINLKNVTINRQPDTEPRRLGGDAPDENLPS